MSTADKILIFTACFTGILTLLTTIVAKFIESDRSKFNQLAAQREVVYEKIIYYFLNMLSNVEGESSLWISNSLLKSDQQELIQEQREIREYITIYGSVSTVKVYGKLQQELFNLKTQLVKNPDYMSPTLALLIEELIVALRIDMGIGHWWNKKKWLIQKTYLIDYKQFKKQVFWAKICRKSLNEKKKRNKS
jgi:hypothetical protein